MKANHLLILFFLFSQTTKLHGQIAISLPELMYFYQGFDNKVVASSKKGVKHIDLLSPDFIFTQEAEKGEGHYIVRAIGAAGSSKIYMVDRKKRDTIDVFEVLILKLPDPDLYFGGVEEGGTAYPKETRFFAKYSPDIPLAVNFSILGGKITLESGKQFIFNGNQLTKEIQNAISSQGNGTTVTGDFEVKGPDGLTRKITGAWKL